MNAMCRAGRSPGAGCPPSTVTVPIRSPANVPGTVAWTWPAKTAATLLPWPVATGHGNNVAAVFAGQVHATVPGTFAGERIGTVTVLGGQPAPGDRPALHIAFIFQLLPGRHLIQQAQLFLAVFQLTLQLENHFGQLRGTVGITGKAQFFRATHCRRLVEIEFVTGHQARFHKALTEGIQAQHTALDLTQAKGQGVYLLLYIFPNTGKLGLLLLQL